MEKKTKSSSNDTEEKQESSSHSDTAKKLSTNQKIMIGGFAGVIVTVAVVAAIIIAILNKPDPVVKEGGNLIINEGNVQQIKDDIDAAVADGMFMTDMNIDWSFPDGASASTDAHVGNSASNHYPIRFEVILSNSGEVVYTSDVIPVGYSIKDVKLEKALEAGTYDAVCKYSLLDEETGEEKSNLSIGITIRIRS